MRLGTVLNGISLGLLSLRVSASVNNLKTTIKCKIETVIINLSVREMCHTDVCDVHNVLSKYINTH